MIGTTLRKHVTKYLKRATLNQLAKETDIPQSTLHSWYHCGTVAKETTLNKLADFFNMELRVK